MLIDFTSILAGPYCTRLMADLGVETVKIESRDGDHIRHRPPYKEGQSTFYANLNCGKKSLCIDLRKSGARDVIVDLVKRADVLVENFRPGVMERLELSYQHMREFNHRLIYCSISGYGQTGEFATRGALAPIIHAISGFNSATLSKQENRTRPLNTGPFVADILAGSLAFGAIQTALLERHQSGHGDHIDVSLLDAMLGLQIAEVQDAQCAGVAQRIKYCPILASDGFIITAPVTQRNFKALVRLIRRMDLLGDSRFSSVKAREQNWSALMSELECWSCQRSSLECETLLNDAGVPAARYLSTQEAMNLPHVRGRGTFVSIASSADPFLVADTPFKFTRSKAHARLTVSRLGQDSHLILSNLLNYSENRIAQLIADNIVMCGD